MNELKWTRRLVGGALAIAVLLVFDGVVASLFALMTPGLPGGFYVPGILTLCLGLALLTVGFLAWREIE